MQDGQINHGYTPLYDEIALYPEVGRFRRFAAQWAKKLHDDTKELLQSEKTVNEELKAKVSDGGVTVLDCPRSLVKEKYPEVYMVWMDYEESLLKYGQSLCLSEQILKLPDHAPYLSKHLAKFSQPIFQEGVFGPTGEKAMVYQGTPHRTDTCAWRTLPQGDILTTLFINHSDWIEKHILGRLRRLWTRRKHSQPGKRTDVRHDIIVGTMDILTCVFAALLLTAAMFALVSVGPLRARIAMVGVFGLVFSLSVKATAGHPSRGEVFAATAAFFAVASVFVGTTNDYGDGH